MPLTIAIRLFAAPKPMQLLRVGLNYGTFRGYPETKKNAYPASGELDPQFVWFDPRPSQLEKIV